MMNASRPVDTADAAIPELTEGAVAAQRSIRSLPPTPEAPDNPSHAATLTRKRVVFNAGKLDCPAEHLRPVTCGQRLL
jgi:hypothetical protein